jgi:hypothetical protein
VILPLNPAQVVLQAVASSAVVSGTVRVFHVAGGVDVNDLATHALTNPYDNVWRYLWAPSSLAPGNYTAYFLLTDALGNTWAATEDLVILPDLTLVRKILTNRKRQTSSNTFVIYDDDGSTPLQTQSTYDIDGNPADQNVAETR